MNPSKEPTVEETIDLLAEVIDVLLGHPVIAPMLDGGLLSWSGREALVAYAMWRSTGMVPA